MTGLLDGRVALVTGGGRGIGRAISLELASQGAKVFLNYTTGGVAANETVALCSKNGGIAETIQFDVSQSASVDAAIDTIKQKAGRIDILVNNAGISRDGLVLRMKDDDWEKVIATNLSGAFYCSRGVSRLMVKERYGRIINISSVVGEMGNAGQVPYVSSKAGLIGLTKALAKELSPRNITVNAVAPGFIETDMTAGLDEKVRAQHLSVIPLQRYGTPHEVAKLVAFLCGDDSGYITGQIVGINGGMYM